MILRNVRCKWASVIEPNTKYEHCWEIVALLDTEQAAVLADQGLKLKTEDDGTQSFRFKRKVEGKKKEGGTYTKEAPKVIDAEKQPFTQLVGNGSLVNIQYAVKTYNIMNQTFIVGDLQGVQVIEHVPFGTGDEFSDEGTTKAIEDPSPNPTVADEGDPNPF